MRIILIEDERELAEVLKKGLQECGYAVDVSYDGVEGLFMLENYPADVAILDLMLPGIDGLTLLQKARVGGVETPILILTAKGTTADKIKGLDCGADDYLAKPFDFEELLARIRALLRRNSESRDSSIQIADLVVNTSTHLVLRGSERIFLTAREYALLEFMAYNRDKVVSRTDIIEHIYNEEFDLDSNVIDVYINYLRNKIDKNRKPQLIHTIRGAGYILTDSH